MFRSPLSFGPRLTLLACAAMLYSGGAVAALSDTIHPFVAIGYTYDDNLLRLSDDTPEGFQRSDRARQAQAGVSVERPFGRQLLTGTAKVSRVTFDHYDQLDYNGKDLNADLAWQLGNRWSGHLGGTYVETLTPFSDTSTSQRNLRTTRGVNATANWRFHPSWRLRGGYTRNTYAYELAIQQVNDRDTDLIEFGGDYLARSGSTAGLVARQIKGKYKKPRQVGGVVLDNDFTQNELKANISWLVSGVTQVTVLAGYAKREYDVFQARDSSGFNGRAGVRWAPLGKVSFNAELWREFAAVESLVVNSSLNRGASLSATWAATGKIQAKARVRHETRRFELLSDNVANVDDADTTNAAQLGVTYAPTRATQLSVSLFREKREGSPLVGSRDYRAKGVSLNATVQF
jgi:exopolysaccharide biosynthesis operon protein EpsL